MLTFVIVGVVALWLLPDLLVDLAKPKTDAAPLTWTERAEALTSARQGVLWALGGLLALLTLWFTRLRDEQAAAKLQLERDAHWVERFTTAITQIGNNGSATIRVGGIYGLEQFATHSLGDRHAVVNILEMFLQEHSLATTGTVTDASPDAKAAATALSRISQLPGIPKTVDLSQVNLTGSDLSGGLFPYANFSGAEMAGANFREATLLRARLVGVNLQDASLLKADLTSADLSLGDLDHANLSGALLVEANLSDARLRGARFLGADMRSAILGGADLTDAKLPSANLAGVTLRGSILRNADFMGANLSDAKFEGADITGASFIGADLSGADLWGAKGATESQLGQAGATKATTWPAGLVGPGTRVRLH